MITGLLEKLSLFIIASISSLGYWGIMAMMAIESACIPLPSEVIMPFSGYLVFTGRFNFWLVGLAGAVGCNLGSAAAYYVGAHGGRPLIEKYGRYLLLSPKDLEWADRWFNRYGEATVFFSRLLPVIRTFIAFPAGVVRMNLFRFHLYTFVGSLPWCLLLAFAGMKLGSQWTKLRAYFHRLDLVLGALIVLGLVLFVKRHWGRGWGKEA
ncbi:MAG: DedA family protein [Acidobacteriia bacterium]|nr:DedA family protein [Terriglobia bacterium]